MIKLFWHPIFSIVLFGCFIAISWLYNKELKMQKERISSLEEHMIFMIDSRHKMDSMVIEFMVKDKEFHSEIVEKFESW
jgi:hypothetical protein